MNSKITLTLGNTLIYELLALMKGVAHALVVPSGITMVAASFGAKNIEATSLGLIYILFSTFMYEYYAEKNGGQWLRGQKYYYATILILFVTMITMLISTGKGY